MKSSRIVLGYCLMLTASFVAAQGAEPRDEPVEPTGQAEYSIEVTAGPPRGAVLIPPGDAPSWPFLVSVRAVHRPPGGEDGSFISIRNIEVFPGEENQRRRSQDGYVLWCISNIDSGARTADVEVRLVHDGRFVLHQRSVINLSPSIPPGE